MNGEAETYSFFLNFIFINKTIDRLYIYMYVVLQFIIPHFCVFLFLF